jgi:rRNA maturation RNase YbeY
MQEPDFMEDELEDAIQFFVEDIDFDLPEPEAVAAWLESVVAEHGYELAGINYIFCSDDYLHSINVEYLDHDTLTDIITFDNSEEEGWVESDIFVSVERVRDNAEQFGVAFEQELLRVMVHGVLHLVGFKDKTEEQAAEMRRQEDHWVQAFLQ